MKRRRSRSSDGDSTVASSASGAPTAAAMIAVLISVTTVSVNASPVTTMMSVAAGSARTATGSSVSDRTTLWMRAVEKPGESSAAMHSLSSDCSKTSLSQKLH